MVDAGEREEFLDGVLRPEGAAPVAGNWTFVVVTDRVELDDQIAKTFKPTGAVSEAEGDQCHAASGAHLRHFLGRGFVGNAMVVSIEKALSLKMHEKVRKHWNLERERVERELARMACLPLEQRNSAANLEQASELAKRLDVACPTWP